MTRLAKILKRLAIGTVVALVLVVASPFVLFGLLILDHSWNPPTPERTAMGLEIAGHEVAIERVAIHPFLAEFDRWIVVTAKGREVERFPIRTDSGGGQHVNVYRTSPTTLGLEDRFGETTVTLGRRIRTLSLPDGPEPAFGREFLGAFDAVRDGSRPVYRFVSADQQPERAVESMRLSPRTLPVSRETVTQATNG